jgi:alpha-L-rhamnosidase
MLVAPTGPPVKRIELRAPTAITQSPSGATIVDHGRNLVGRFPITIRGEAGREIALSDTQRNDGRAEQSRGLGCRS